MDPILFGRIAQLARAPRLHRGGPGFESLCAHHLLSFPATFRPPRRLAEQTMNAFPNEPVSPREFIEEVVPALFAEIEFDDRAESIDLKLGIRLDGDGGGAWTLHFVADELGIVKGLSEGCALTVFQSVADWRSGLWEGRPKLVADIIEQVRNAAEAGIGTQAGSDGLANPDALRELEGLSGRIDAIIEADDSPDSPDAGEWRIGIQIGPGAISETPNATLRIGAKESEALRRGDLHPLEALITGQLRLEGDLGLIFQLQAIAMAASMPASSGE